MEFQLLCVHIFLFLRSLVVLFFTSMTLDNYQKVVDVECCLQKEKRKDDKTYYSVGNFFSFFSSVCSACCWVGRVCCSFSSEKTGSSGECKPAKGQLEGWRRNTFNGEYGDPLAVAETLASLSTQKGQLSPFLAPFRFTSNKPVNLPVESSSRSRCFYFLLVFLHSMTLIFFFFCVVGKIYLWVYPILPPEMIWIENVLVEVTEEETWLESWWKWSGLWKCLGGLILLAFAFGQWPFFLQWINASPFSYSSNKNLPPGIFFSRPIKENSRSSWPCRKARTVSFSPDEERKNGTLSSSLPLNDRKALRPLSHSCSAKPISLLPSFTSSPSNRFQPFSRTFSPPRIRNAKDLDRFLNNSARPHAALPNNKTLTTLDGEELSLGGIASFSPAVADGATTVLGSKSNSTRTSSSLRTLEADETRKGISDLQKGSTASLPLGSPWSRGVGRRDRGLLGSAATPMPSLHLQGGGISGGISVRYNELGSAGGLSGGAGGVDSLRNSKGIASKSNTGSPHSHRKQMDSREGYALNGVNGAVWEGLGMMDAFHVRASMIKLKEHFQHICAELLRKVDATNAWFGARGLSDFDCSHSLEETCAGHETHTFGATGGFNGGIGGGSSFGNLTRQTAHGEGGGLLFGGGGGGIAVGQSGVGFRSNTYGSGGFGQSNILSSPSTTFSVAGAGSSSIAKITKRMYLLQEKEKLRQQCQQAIGASGPVGVGGGGFSSTLLLRPSPGLSTSSTSPIPLTRSEMMEKIAKIDERLQLDEKLNVFNTFPLPSGGGTAGTARPDALNSASNGTSTSASPGGARCQQQQQYLLHRAQIFASPLYWNPKKISSQELLTEDVGTAASAEIWYEKDASDRHTEGASSGTGRCSVAPLVDNDAYLMLHLLRYGIEGLSSFIRCGHFSSSSRGPELCICVGDVGIPYFYVVLRTTAMDVPLGLSLEPNTTPSDGVLTGSEASRGGVAFPHPRLSFSSSSLPLLSSWLPLSTRRQLGRTFGRQHIPRDSRNKVSGGHMPGSPIKTIRMNVAGLLKKLQYSHGNTNSEVEGVRVALSNSGVGLTSKSWPFSPSWREGISAEDRHDEVPEDEEVVLSTKPGPNSLWEALLLFICIVYRFYNGSFHSIRGTLNLESNGLMSVVEPFSTVFSSHEKTRRTPYNPSAMTEPEGWLRRRSLFTTKKEILD